MSETPPRLQPDAPESFLDRLLPAFRAGDAEAAQALMQHYAPWLRLLARVQVESNFRAKFDPSDIVQQTMMEACKAATQFRGRSEGEWLGWLRRILAHALAHEIRRYRGTQKRDLAREQPLDLEDSSARLAEMLPATATSPSQRAVQREREVLLAELLERLPADYREVIILRNLQGLSHEDVARRMNRSPGATRMLWARALAALKETAGAPP